MTTRMRRDKISQLLAQLLARVGWKTTMVALANKNARILWTVLDNARRLDANHVSTSSGEKPAVPAMVESAIAA